MELICYSLEIIVLGFSVEPVKEDTVPTSTSTPNPPFRAESELRDIDQVDSLVRPLHAASDAGVSASGSTSVSVQEEEELTESFDRVRIDLGAVPGLEEELEVDIQPEVMADAEVQMTEPVDQQAGTSQPVYICEMVEETIVDDADETIGQIAVCHTREVGVADNNVAEADVDSNDEAVEGDGAVPDIALDITGTEEIAEEPAFYLDVNPTLDTDEPAERFIFDTITSAPIGEQSSSESEEEEIVLVPRKHVQPEPIHLPEEPEYVRAKEGESKAKQSLTDKFGGKAGKDGRPVATTSLPSKKSTRTAVEDIADADEEITTASKGKKLNKKQAKREKRKNKKDERMKKTEGIVRHKVPRMDSDVEWGSDGPPKGVLNELVTDEEDDAAAVGASRGMIGGLSTKGLTGAKKREMELLMDYLENTVGTEEPDSEDDEVIPRIGGGLTDSSMAAFIKGMSGSNQVTIDDINDARMLAEEDDEEDEDEDEDGWEDSSGSELTDDDKDEAQPVPPTSAKKPKSKLVEIAPGLLSQVDDGMDDSFDVDEEELDDTSGDEGAEMAGMGFGWAVPASSDSSSDSDSDEDKGDEDDIDKIFSGKRGKSTWADAADDFISAMDELVDDSDLVMGSGKKFEKNKLFKAIHNGDFGDNWATSELSAL